jgi:hypothetical protein
MTITISYTISDEVNFEDVGLGEPDPLTTLTPIYGNRDWSFKLNFSGVEDSTGNSISITNITTSTPSYINSSYSLATVTLSKNPSELIFPGEQYRFVRFETQELFTYVDISNLPSGLSIIGWDTPTQEEITATYVFTITYDVPLSGLTGQTEIYTLVQDLYWDFEPGWIKLQQQVSNSET